MTPMNARTLLAAAAALFLAAPAFAATSDKAPDSTRNCFLAHQWQSWKALNDKTILVRVNTNDVWRLDLNGGSRMITDQTNHLITHLSQSAWICTALDLASMQVSDGHITEPLFVRSVTKLTPDEVAALPQKDRP
jgi:hypothetical protein